jgi:hypothetical protein
VSNAYPLIAEPDLEEHLGFLLAEEESLKKYLSNIVVPTKPGSAETTKVGVWFRYPEGERQIKYPYITIDLLSVEPNYELFTSTHIQDPTNLYRPSFSPTLPAPLPGMTYNVREYLAFTLTWQVAVYSRSALHDRYLTSIFATDVLPPRPFFIDSLADGVARRTDRTGFQAADTLETNESGTKRIFRKIYTLNMLTEIPQQRFPTDLYGYQALRILIPVVAREQFDNYFHEILEGHVDPMSEFTTEERAAEGEYGVVALEGINTPAP